MLKVCKFGGSSLADASQYQKVKNIVCADPARKIVVVSAPGKRFSDDHKITDLLYLCHAHIQYGVSCDSVWEMIKDRYLSIRDDLKLNVDLESEFDELRSRMTKKMTQDELVSRGEYFSAKLMAAFLGYDFIDSSMWVTFELSGHIDLAASYEKLEHLAADRSVVIPGFYGAMPDGTLKLMSRGGSDITGALAAAALNADVYENWTDVSGILMADPRIVENARSIPKVTYSELRELSYIGAQVLHEDTIFPVRQKNIALNIRNTNDPSAPGTMIRESFEDDTEGEDIITGIAGRKGYMCISVYKSGMSSAVGEYRKILSVFERFNISVQYITCGIDCYTVFVEDSAIAAAKYQILAALQKEINADDIRVSENIAMLAIVGRKMAFRSGSSGKIFQALGEHGINIRMISQGPEELNIIIGVNESDFKNAVRALYSKFVK